jgi:very-short-patch-repair endonuclease
MRGARAAGRTSKGDESWGLVDLCLVWRDARLIVETDGWGAHRTRAAFERDRLRDAELTAAGWRVVRLTTRRLERDGGAVAVQLGRLLA